MHRWGLLLVIACGGTEPSKPSPLVGQTRALVDRMCACRDAACVATVDAAWNAAAKTQPSRLSADDVEALAQLTLRYAKCMAELR